MSRADRTPNAKRVLGIVIALSLFAVATDKAFVGWLVAPLVIGGIFYVFQQVPLRTSLLGLMFCGMTLENPSENFAYGVWHSPISVIGALMLSHMNTTTGISFLSFSGMDLMLLMLFFVSQQRRKSSHNIDAVDNVPTPRPLVKLAQVALLGTLYVWLNGMLHGGDFSKSLWQLDRVVYLPIIFLLFQRGLRGPQDGAALTKVVVASATIRAIVATYVVNNFHMDVGPGEDPTLPYGTTHHDSVLFAAAMVMLVSDVMHRVDRHAWRRLLLFGPVIVIGMTSNHRRMVWVQIILVFLTLFFVMPDSPIRRRIKRIVVIAAPFIVVYCAIGWNQASGVFKPVQTIRSVVEPSTDASSMTREIENYDLITTLRAHPLLGAGYGIGYTPYIPLPPMPYPLEAFIPHNSLLGLWCFCGYFGYTAMTLLWAAGVYFGTRAYAMSEDRTHRARALISFGSVLIYLIQCWGDMGLGSWTGVFLTASGIAMSGKLAVVCGAWLKPATSKAPGKRAAPGVAGQLDTARTR